LIEAAGLKGAREGEAEISAKHANFFVNRGGARAADVWALIERARTAVKEQFGVGLELEVELIGDWERQGVERPASGGAE
jgi:UDP-N-acetylmuramate dehydrogenase